MTKVVLKCPSCGHMIDFGPNWVPVEISKPKTNADRIREMDDKKLAEWLDELITHCNDGPCFNCFMQKACLTSMSEWLKQEVDTNDS